MSAAPVLVCATGRFNVVSRSALSFLRRLAMRIRRCYVVVSQGRAGGIHEATSTTVPVSSLDFGANRSRTVRG